ncbi:MAG TPA: 5-methyltetrahydropteroyltriglutamate--homocysteine S-methyltransferase [Xanthobacteraceae bacterium]|jgi:5-methyltetrahydropteroyltriglutamate--homocysteine methyltransferase
MQRSKPPFRADHVGSLLRTGLIKQARTKREKGEISAAQLKEVEDREIPKVIRKQEEVGLRSITDGEERRAWWHLDFLEALDGTEAYEMPHGVQFHGAQTKPKGVRTVGRLGFSGHPMLEHFAFLKAHTKQTPKMTIPSPSALYARASIRDAVVGKAYPEPEEFYRDLGETYRKAIRAFYDAGCRYLQLDEVFLVLLCDEGYRNGVIARGDDPAKIPLIEASIINAALKGLPADMTITMHLCRGNFRSTFVGSGGYEPIAEVLLQGINVHGYFMEYDTERAGGFEPLRFLPNDKTVVLGLVTSKFPQLEPKDEIKRRIDQAAKFASLDRLCLSPQCGFASTEEGNVLTEDQQWAKLRHVVEIADEVWG